MQHRFSTRTLTRTYGTTFYASLASLVLAVASLVTVGQAQASSKGPIVQKAAAIEEQLQARVGVAVIDTASGQSWLYKADERFPMASTAKTLVCAALLQQGEPLLHSPVLLQPDDIQTYAPVTKELVGQTMSAFQLCEITLRSSDNTAVNLVLNVVGGPSAVTSFLRRIGDQVTRLDRLEPEVNEAKPGDERDTTTPAAMAATMRALLLDSALNPTMRAQLVEWLKANDVAGPLLRAGVPSDWVVADRSGSAEYGTRGVAAVMWPTQHAPIVAAVYITETDAPIEARNAAIASIGQAIAEELSLLPNK
ncbi:class A beta-lactamase [Alcaligenaceae bacterium 429]|nr:class A beta-lactamase [Alcaligenaceae bacterium 429]